MAGQGRLSKNRAIIDQAAGRYRMKSRHHRRMARSRLIAKAGGYRRRLHLVPLNELERQRSARRSRQQAPSDRPRPISFRPEYRGATADPVSDWAPDATYEVFIGIAFRLDRRNTVPVEEFGRGRCPSPCSMRFFDGNIVGCPPVRRTGGPRSPRAAPDRARRAR
jgi:hypothetical protein